LMAGSTRSKQRPDTLLQDRIARIEENLLHRTAGPYIWVKNGEPTQPQQATYVSCAPQTPIAAS
jgi:hypothetical protein